MRETQGQEKTWLPETWGEGEVGRRRTGEGARSVHLQILSQAGCPLITRSHWHTHTTNSSTPGWSPPRAPLGSSHASFYFIVLTAIGIWKHCKNASAFSYMEIVAMKVLVWGKVVSFLEGGEPGFIWSIVGQSDLA